MSYNNWAGKVSNAEVARGSARSMGSWGRALAHTVIALTGAVGFSLSLQAQPSYAQLISPLLDVRPNPNSNARKSVPFGVGEHLTYDVKFGVLRVGQGQMEVLGLTDVRGQEAWHTRFTVKGGVPFYRVNDRMESWIDSRRLTSLRFSQDLQEGGRSRTRSYELFPERSVFLEGNKPEEQPSVEEPLDDGAFLYFVRTIPLEVGETYDFDRYFRPDRNPVRIRVLRRERVTVPAGTFETIVIQPIIKTAGIFSERGEAQMWLTDDDRRMLVQMKSKLPFGSLNLYLREVVPGSAPQ
jgi:hypothetical protein